MSFYFNLIAYLKVFIVWSALIFPGLTHEIIIILERFPFHINESLNAIVNLEALNGIWVLFVSIALMHSFKANKLLLIYAPYSLLYRLLLYQS